MKCNKCLQNKPESCFSPIKNFKRYGCKRPFKGTCKECKNYMVRQRKLDKNARGKRKCLKCNEMAVTAHIETSLCQKHLKFSRMRVTAKVRGLYVPSFNELDVLFNKINLVCPVCNNKMTLNANGDSKKRSLTLQHDGNNKINFLCQSCNSKEYRAGQDIYIHGIDSKICPNCNLRKHVNEFYRCKTRLASYCVACSRNMDKRSNHNKKQNSYEASI